FVNAVARRKIRSLQPFATSDVYDFWIRRSNGKSTNGTGGLILEDWLPRMAEISGLPNTSVVYADVEHIRLTRHAGRTDSAATAEWTDHAPLHTFYLIRRRLLRVNCNCEQAANKTDRANR